MSDLISKSNLIMRLSDYALQESPNDNESTGEQRISKMIYDAIQNCISCVEEQPTAYDPDNVVSELKTDSSVKLYGSQNSDNHMIPVKRAIEIVKNGGVADDCCEWKLEDDNLMTGCGDYFNLYDNCTGKFKYCPYCGKKIKAVDVNG